MSVLTRLRSLDLDKGFGVLSEAIDHVYDIVSPKAGLKRKLARTALRSYEAASVGRRTKDMPWSGRSANQDINSKTGVLATRGRDLVMNNAYAARGAQAVVSNVVGSGIRAQSKSNSSNIEKAWRAWAETTQCDSDGIHNIYGLQRLVMNSIVQSGECLVRFRKRTSSYAEKNNLSIPLQIQILEPEYLAKDIDMEMSVGSRKNIIGGIEFDSKGRRVAYHIYKSHPSEGGFGPDETIRVPSTEMKHILRKDRPGQQRGVSWFHPVMITLKDLDAFMDAELVKQKVASCFTAFIKDLDPESMSSKEQETLTHMEPGAIHVLGSGKDVTMANPPTHNTYDTYVKSVLHQVSAGLGISYEALTGDLSDVNFSSARMGWIEFGKNIKQWQEDIVINLFCIPVWDQFETMYEVLSGVKQSTRGSSWTVPRRDFVDPEKEIKASRMMVRAGLSSLSEEQRKSGYDPDDLMNEIKSDFDKISSLDLILDSDPRTTSQQGQMQPSLYIKNDSEDESDRSAEELLGSVISGYDAEVLRGEE